MRRFYELIFKVLSESNDFKAAVKRVVAAQGVGVAVVNVFAAVIALVRFESTPVRRISDKHGFKTVVEVPQSDGRVAVSGGLAFRAAGLRTGNTVVLERSGTNTSRNP